MSKELNEEKPKHKFKLLFIIITLFLFFSCVILYSRFIGTYGLSIKEYKIKNTIFSENFHGLKIVHISDIHYGRTINKKELDKLVKKINLLNPDIIVLTGDLIDRNTVMTESIKKDIVNSLSKIKATNGKYAISGNHDVKFNEWADIIKDSQFTNLNESYDVIYNSNGDSIFIGGLSSTINDKNVSFEQKINTVNTYINTINNNSKTYKILLLHEPDFINDFDYSKYDLILSGHSHNGQVRIPLIGAIVLPDGAKKYYKEYYKLKDTELYISSGVGTSTINFRLFNRPSINFYRLTNK